jgi:ABC transporter DrrB family efflux protein
VTCCAIRSASADRIGYVPQAIGVTAGGTDPSCLVCEELAIQGRLYRLSAADAAERARMLITQLELTGLERRLCKTLSGGQRRRLDIALGLIHSPVLLFLDEPTTGLDPQSRSNLWDHIRGLREKLGTTVFLTTHYLEEADALCDRVLVIDHGKIIAAGVPDELKRQISGDVVTLSVNGDQGQARAILAGHPGVREISSDGQAIRMSVAHGEEALPGMLRALDGGGITMESISLARPTLDDVFLTLTGRSLRDDPQADGPPVTADGHVLASADGADQMTAATATAPPAKTTPGRSTPLAFLSDTALVFRRQMRLSLRNPAWVIIGLIQPILYLAFFGPLLARIAHTGAMPGVRPGSPYTFFVPGLLVQLGLFGAAFVGFAIIADWRAGVIERFRVTPVSRIAPLVGRVLRDVLTLSVQALVLILAGLAFGLRVPLAGAAIGLCVVALVAVSLSAMSYAVGLVLKSEDALGPLLNMFVVPLMLLSGIMLPMTLGPAWLRDIARATPFGYIINAMRDVFAGHYGTAVVAEGIAVAVGLAIGCLWLAGRAFARENA